MSCCQNVTPSDELAKRKTKLAEMEQELAAEHERVRKKEEEEVRAREAAEVQRLQPFSNGCERIGLVWSCRGGVHRQWRRVAGPWGRCLGAYRHFTPLRVMA